MITNSITIHPLHATIYVWHTWRMIIQGVISGRKLGLVDLEFDCSTVCSTLPRLEEIWQKRLGSWAKWWNPGIKFNQTQVSVTRWDTLYNLA